MMATAMSEAGRAWTVHPVPRRLARPGSAARTRVRQAELAAYRVATGQAALAPGGVIRLPPGPVPVGYTARPRTK